MYGLYLASHPGAVRRRRRLDAASDTAYARRFLANENGKNVRHREPRGILE